MLDSEKEVYNKFLNSDIAKRKYQEFLKEENDGLTEEEWSFSDWIYDYIDEYGLCAFDIVMSNWKKEDSLFILDLKRLQITKVYLWNVYFTYDNISYFLHYSDNDGEEIITLYKKIYNGNHYELIALNSMYSSTFPQNLFIRKKDKIKKGGKSTLVYNQIDKDFFVKKLVMENLCFASDKIMTEVNYYKEKAEEIKQMINNLDKQRNYLYSELRKVENFK